MLRLNFFSTWLPEEELPILARDRDPTTKLQPWERNVAVRPVYQLESESDSSRGKVPQPRKNTAVVGGILNADDRTNYIQELWKARDLDPGILKPLLATGLQQALRTKGLEIETDPVSFATIDLGAESKINLPPEVAIRRGMRFRVDHLVVRGRRIYGFFVSPVSRLAFANGFESDEPLRTALIGERIFVRLGGTIRSAQLKSIDYLKQTAVILMDADAVELPLADAIPRATTKAISRYFSLLGRPDQARDIRLASQVASFRLLPNGQRNRRWLVHQYEYVCSWLLSQSESGRLRFQWPFSNIEVYTNAEALELT
jgi:hypothetical protein